MVTKNVRQLAIGEKLLIKRSFPKAGVVITVAAPIQALHHCGSPKNSRINNTLQWVNLSVVLHKIRLTTQYVPLTTVLIVLQKLGLRTHCS